MRQRVKIVIKEEIVRELYAIAGEDAVQTAEPMKNHTTFRVGGPADYFVAPHTEEEIRKIVALCEEKEIPVHLENLEGNAAAEIINYAKRENAFMIVAGTRGLGGFNRLLLGSTAQALITYSDISVLIAK